MKCRRRLEMLRIKDALRYDLFNKAKISKPFQELSRGRRCLSALTRCFVYFSHVYETIFVEVESVFINIFTISTTSLVHADYFELWN